MRLHKKDPVSEEATFKDDKLNRQQIAENFNLLFERAQKPYVIALDSPWGTGKTQFIHMWRNLLKEGNRESIYINIWEEDFLNNPFFSLSEALYDKFQEKNIGESQALTDWKKIGWELGRAAVDKVLNINIDNIASEDYNKKQKRSKEKFKKNLSKLASDLRGKTDFPLIIFIDELDRCRPRYAVEFLEIIKHFFDVENIIFVLGIDIKQLQHSVKSLYGLGMNAEEYLRKFIDVDYTFPEPLLEDYMEFLFEEFSCGKNISPDQIDAAKKIIGKFKPAPRAMDNLFTRLKLIEKEVSQIYVHATFLLALKMFRRAIYEKIIIERKFNLDEVWQIEQYLNIKNNLSETRAFWDIANALILEMSENPRRYLQNLQGFSSRLYRDENRLKPMLSKYLRESSSGKGFQEIKYGYDLATIFLEDKNITSQPNITKVENIFKDKTYNLKEFEELIQRIDFLEGLNFSSDIESEKQADDSS